MGWRSKRWIAVAVAAARAVLAAGCGQPAPAPTTVSPAKGLVASTVAGTRSVPSVIWRVYRDVDSLDPIYSTDFPECTALTGAVPSFAAMFSPWADSLGGTG